MRMRSFSRGACATAVLLFLVLLSAWAWVGPASAGAREFGIEKFTMHTTRQVKTPAGPGEYEYGEPYTFTQAGGHPWALTSTIEFEGEKVGNGVFPVHDPKDVVVDLPPGLLGNPTASPRCPLTQALETGICPTDTQIGEARIRWFGGNEVIGPIVNITPEAGQSAEFGLENTLKVTTVLAAHLVRTPQGTAGCATEGGCYGVTVVSNDIPLVEIAEVETTFWGVPADPSHDSQRGLYCESPTSCRIHAGEKSGLAPVPFLTMPTACSAGPEAVSVRADSWEEPGSVSEGKYTAQYKQASVTMPAVTGCSLVKFVSGTEIKAEPDTEQADAPVGLGVKLVMPQVQKPNAMTAPQLRETKVTLPAGMSVSPGIVDGIKACEELGPEGINITGPESEEVAANGELRLAPGHCPAASTVGSAEAITPLLPEPVKGHVYLARPGCGAAGQHPCTEADALDGNLYKLYLELGGEGELANEGIVFKVPFDVQANPATGQLTTVVRNIMQAPVSEVKVDLNGGPRASLDNPAACGPATTTADFTPWSAPGRTSEGQLVSGTPDATLSSFFNVDLAGDGEATPCPALPFAPGFLAGTVTPNAGRFSSFTMNLSRNDREQYVKGIQVHTPPGLLAVLASVPLCPQAQADDPSVYGECPASSKIGTTRVASGAGSHPFEIEGSVYLTGPHDGAPFGLSIVTHAQAGPFDLGLVVVRARIDIDPSDSTATITTDESGPYAVPRIIFGVPLRLKRITVNIDRPDFMLNPTNCKAQRITASISASQEAVAIVSSPFAASGCRSLAFTPKLTVSTSGHTSRKLGASLDARLSYPKGAMGRDANVAYVKVSLPKQLPSYLPTLQQACPVQTFESNPSQCSKASIVGIARTTTPLLPVQLSGPVYFVSFGGEQFPQLVVVLQGDGVRVDLIGDTFIKHGITSSTFKTVPDVPVDSFELFLPQGGNHALAANGNLCNLTKTVTVRRRVARRVHGRTVHRVVKRRVARPASLIMPTEFIAQNGAVLRQETKIAVTGCGKHKSGGRHRRRGHGARASRYGNHGSTWRR